MFQSTYRLNRVAVVGTIAVGMAVAISSFSIVRAEQEKPANTGIYNCSTGKACVVGNSTSKTWGVYGISTGGDGVHGATSAASSSGVAGVSTGTSGQGQGVLGRSSNGPGVYGSSTLAAKAYTNGIEGYSNSAYGAGVAGYQLNTAGNSGFGVYAESADNTGEAAALYGQGDSSGTYLFEVLNLPSGGYCDITPSASLTCSGSAEFKTVHTRHVTSSGQQVLAYGSESTSATIEDFGTARMHGGVANVYFKRDFASTIDPNGQYYVFLTPLGDTRGLYVSVKTPSGFQVRETGGGRSRIEFDYRIVAHPLNAENDRLPVAPPVKMPRLHPAR